MFTRTRETTRRGLRTFDSLAKAEAFARRVNRQLWKADASFKADAPRVAERGMVDGSHVAVRWSVTLWETSWR